MIMSGRWRSGGTQRLVGPCWGLMRFGYWLPLFAALGIASPVSAVMIDGAGGAAESGITFSADARDLGEHGAEGTANPIDNFVYAGAINHGLPSESGDRLANGSADSPRVPLVGLTNAFSTAPEPGVWLMLVGGFGLIGLAMRRRHSVPSLGHAQIV